MDLTLGIRTIELQDFKSYSGLIVFGPMRRFSAICAPNGSGKSNLMDAIAFVCGERDAAKLRVSRLSDLINNDPNVDQAHVEIVFVDDDEGGVMRFKRTITEDGTSDFLIDGQVVDSEIYDEQLMLRHINIKAGHFLVYQETVASIAMMNQNERTSMFEEISRSCELKAEYERHERQMNEADQAHKFSLQKRKFATAELKSAKSKESMSNQHRMLTSNSNRLKRIYHTFLLYQCEREVGDCEEKVTMKISELEKEVARKASGDEQLNMARGDQGRAQRGHAKLAKELRQLEAERCRKQPAFIQAAEMIKHTKNKIEVANKTLKAAEASQGVHDAEITQLEADLSDVRRQLTELNDGGVTRGIQLDAEQAREYNTLKEEASMRTAGDLVELEKASLFLKTAEERLERETQRKHDLISKLHKKEHDLEEAKRRQDKLEEFIINIKQSLEEQQQKAIDLTEEFNSAKLALKEGDEKIKEVDNKLDEACVNAEELKRLHRLDATLDKLKKRMPGVVFGRISGLCCVKHPRYSIAAMEVIGKKMDFIVVAHKTTAIDCLKYIKQYQLGYEHFIALDFVDAPRVNERLRARIEGDPRGIRLLYDVLDFDPVVKKAIEFVTNNVLVCENSFDANHVAYEMDRGVQYNAVSLNGIFFGKNGKITSGGLRDLKRQAVRWNEAHVDDLKRTQAALLANRVSILKSVRKEVDLIEERSQCVMLKAKEKFATTDKNQQTIVMEALEASIRDMRSTAEELQSSVDVVQRTVDRLVAETDAPRQRIVDVEDGLFEEFCRRIGVPNIRVFEEMELKSQQDRVRLQLTLEDQIGRLETQLEFERSKETAAQVRKWMKEVEDRKKEYEDAVNEFKVQKKVNDNYCEGVEEIKRRLAIRLASLQEMKSNVEEAKNNAIELVESVSSAEENLIAVEADCARKKSERHGLLKKCKIENVALRFNRGDMEDIEDVEVCENGDVSLASSVIYDRESRSIEIDYGSLSNHQKSLEKTDEVNGEAERILREIAELQSHLQDISGQVDIDVADKLPRLQRKVDRITDRFSRTQERATIAKANFERSKAERFRRFDELLNQVSTHIDEIYKELTNDDSAQALVWPENAAEPYLGGVNYHCVSPGKRFLPMSGLSGGEKTIAALALLFAIRRYLKAPFFVLDEVDASLDRKNVNNVSQYVSAEAAGGLQFVVVSLRHLFYGNAEAIFGIPHEPPPANVVKCISLDLTEYDVPLTQSTAMVSVAGPSISGGGDVSNVKA